MNNASAGNRIAGLVDMAPRLIAVASGKGGVGKSIITYNLAQHLSAVGRVLIIDCDFMTGNQHLLGNARPSLGWQDICHGTVTLSEAVCHLTDRLDLLATTGATSPAAIPEIKKLANWLSELRTTCARYDYIMIDTAAGILPHSNLILHSVDEVILLTTPELTAISDCYALYKILVTDNANIIASLLVNYESRSEEITYIFEKFTAIADQFLGHSPAFFGSLGSDRTLVEAVACQKGIAEFAPNSLANKEFAGLAQRLTGNPTGATINLEDININAQAADIRE